MSTDPETQSLEALVSSINAHLTAFLNLLKTKTKSKALHNALHNDEPESLPSRSMTTLANQTINLLHEMEQLFEPSHLVLADHFLGYVQTKCLVAAVDLKIPDLLEEKGPMTLSQLADSCGARADRLSQSLRILYNNGIFSYNNASCTISNNRTSRLLLSTHWTQWHNWVTLYGNQFYDMARGIPESLEKHQTRFPAQINYDTDENMFAYFQKQGWVPQLHRTLGAGATAMAPGIMADYPWSEVAGETVLDIGGGGGAFIASLLRAHATLQGGIFDLPHVIDHARPFFHDKDGQYSDLADRVLDENLISGDFFENIPSSKVYTMKWCLHDWRDADALRILKNIRKAIIPGENSRLIILESIISDGRSSRLARYGDMNMMIAAGGGERTMSEWVSLAAGSGWAIFRVHHLRNAWPCAIDLRPKLEEDGIRKDRIGTGEAEAKTIEDYLVESLGREV